MSPFEAVLGYKPRMPVDLIPMSSLPRPSASAELFAQHIHGLHDEIKKRINMHNESYKTAANTHRRHVDFNIGDYVMIRMSPERFPQGTAKMLQACSIGPFKILKRLGPNACVLELPPDMGISPIFNVEDLVIFRGPTTSPDDHQFSIPIDPLATKADPP